jgi:hypothetical protein
LAFLQLNEYNRIPLILDKQARVSSTETVNFCNNVSADTENIPAAKSKIIQTPVQKAVFIKAWPQGLHPSLEQALKHFERNGIPMT